MCRATVPTGTRRLGGHVSAVLRVHALGPVPLHDGRDALQAVRVPGQCRPPQLDGLPAVGGRWRVDAVGGARRLWGRPRPRGHGPVRRVVIGPAPGPVRSGVLESGRALRRDPPVRRGRRRVPAGIYSDPRAGADDQVGRVSRGPRPIRRGGTAAGQRSGRGRRLRRRRVAPIGHGLRGHRVRRDGGRLSPAGGRAGIRFRSVRKTISYYSVSDAV